MQQSTIKKLLYEKIGTVNSIKLNKKCLTLLDKTIKLENKILALLDGKVKTMFEAYLDMLDQYDSEVLDFYYIEGFKVGLGIGIECKEQKSCN